jgi:hypothetical protein
MMMAAAMPAVRRKVLAVNMGFILAASKAIVNPCGYFCGKPCGRPK